MNRARKNGVDVNVKAPFDFARESIESNYRFTLTQFIGMYYSKIVEETSAQFEEISPINGNAIERMIGCVRQLLGN